MSAGQQAPEASRSVSFILMPGFALTSFSLAVEALSVANHLSQHQRYHYTLYSGAQTDDLSPVFSSNGVPIQPAHHFSECPPCDIMVVCAHQDAARYQDPRLKALLRRQNHQGGVLVALSNGSLLLAHAGVLSAQGCTLTGDDMAVFKELYPDIPIRRQLYTVDDNILTCAGGMTALDLFLYLIGQDYGMEMANQVSHKFLQDRIRSSEEIQYARRSLELRMKSPILGAAIERMENHLDQPLSIQVLAAEIGTTPRTLESVFQRFMQTTPARYYLDLRLDCAYRMLKESHLPILTIGYATGFSSQSYFSRRFRQRFGMKPREARLPQA